MENVEASTQGEPKNNPETNPVKPENPIKKSCTKCILNPDNHFVVIRIIILL